MNGKFIVLIIGLPLFDCFWDEAAPNESMIGSITSIIQKMKLIN